MAPNERAPIVGPSQLQQQRNETLLCYGGHARSYGLRHNYVSGCCDQPSDALRLSVVTTPSHSGQPLQQQPGQLSHARLRAHCRVCCCMIKAGPEP